MRKLNTFGAVLLAGLALSAMLAGGAYAKSAKPTLILKENGVALANGAPAYSSFYSEGCIARGQGKLTTNNSKKDKASFTSSARESCAEGVKGLSISGYLTSVQLTTAGLASFKANVTVTLPGPCAYTVKKLTAEFNPSGGELFALTTAAGKLAKGSSKSCPKTDTLEVDVGVENEEAEAFNTELS